MTEDDDTGPEGGRAIASRLVYDPSIATVDEATFNELVALMRDGRPSKVWGQHPTVLISGERQQRTVRC